MRQEQAPKDKAFELIKIAFDNIVKNSDYNGVKSCFTGEFTIIESLSKKIALEYVNEIIKAIDWHLFDTPNKELEYWNKVKSEITDL